VNPRLLDLYCCAGGASMGYHRAGFTVYGSDIARQPHYPFAFHQGDAIDVMATLLRGDVVDFTHQDGRVEWLTLADFDAFAGSPPCQAFTLCQRIQGNDHPDLIDATRDAFESTGRPWVIENVVGAPLRSPVMLCGAMFVGLQVYRHRLFEASFPIAAPPHPEHAARVTKMGRPPVDGEFMHVVGNFAGVAKARTAMGVPWMVRDEMREAIPPAFTEHIGHQLAAHLESEAAA
jgi:DNA (cytosine-5)-methyltransferase 1